ncbi:MAG: hypothetical protein J6I58_03155 [Eubacterium sp.]|nr:hypothetical protein [Eubacterium sp.]
MKYVQYLDENDKLFIINYMQEFLLVNNKEKKKIIKFLNIYIFIDLVLGLIFVADGTKFNYITGSFFFAMIYITGFEFTKLLNIYIVKNKYIKKIKDTSTYYLTEEYVKNGDNTYDIKMFEKCVISSDFYIFHISNTILFLKINDITQKWFLTTYINL